MRNIGMCGMNMKRVILKQYVKSVVLKTNANNIIFLHLIPKSAPRLDDYT